MTHHLSPGRRTVLGGLAAGAAAAAGGLPVATAAAAAEPRAAASSAAPRRAGAVVTYRDKQLLVDGRPTIVLAGEIHYFRLKRGDWQSRLDLAKAAGLNTIATYIPWMWHELPDGSLDVTGHSRPERDLGAFLDLCVANGFHVIARPGPFTMAELKGEGIPARVRREHPEINTKGWNGDPGTAQQVDYLAPAFLKEARRWYDTVVPVIAKRLPGHGRPGVIGVQLDNEVGMLAWVSNGPDLTDHTAKDFDAWLRHTYGDRLADRYPFAGAALPARLAAVRAPKDGYAAALMHDLGVFFRGRHAEYIRTLRGWAEENGITGIPFAVNIHGTGGGHGASFPIGISQLMESYAGVPGMISGSDMYLNDLTVNNVTDLYVMNAFMDAVHDRHQPLASLEFDAGSGDYGEDKDAQIGPSGLDLKTRLCLAQGHRLLNYYLFAGGFNPKLDKPVGDGNDRIGITGERHGFAAPVTPEGTKGITYDSTRSTLAAVNALAPVLATMRPQTDGVSLGFVPDHYLTEYRPPGSDTVQRVLSDLEPARGFGPRGSLTRALLFGGVRYDSVDLQAGDLDPRRVPVLALASGEHLDAKLQQRLVTYVRSGGRLLLSGRLPVKDMADGACTVLADALGLSGGRTLTDADRFWLSVTGHGWAAGRPEVRVPNAQLWRADRGSTVLREVSTGEGCAFDVPLGRGSAVVVTTAYPCDLVFWGAALKALGAAPGLAHSAVTAPGVFFLTTRNADGGRLLHAFNTTSGYAQSVTVSERGKALFGGAALHLAGRSAAMLPLDLKVGGLHLAHATAEITRVGGSAVSFRALGDEAVVAVEGRAVCEGAKVTSEGGRTLLRVRRREFTVRRG
ncbi:beta-galactosidase [Streptomyces tropicalis]|uniref:Beta-galactosidase n=1 Tax=Streptomyces tropicalis TaxID=3034234 RepID=A0ABT6A4C2_9ACTN|nr:beta-galactosidase [Streptomyces tropicalis]MDF3299491.1 beta-galactosidase [Streptomyces tropicalis]